MRQKCQDSERLIEKYPMSIRSRLNQRVIQVYQYLFHFDLLFRNKLIGRPHLLIKIM